MPGLKKEQFLQKYAEQQRANSILLGDILQDAQMCDDSDYDNVIRIGFLDEPEKEKLDMHLSVFDLVIANDGSMCPIMHILNFI